MGQLLMKVVQKRMADKLLEKGLRKPGEDMKFREALKQGAYRPADVVENRITKKLADRGLLPDPNEQPYEKDAAVLTPPKPRRPLRDLFKSQETLTVEAMFDLADDLPEEEQAEYFRRLAEKHPELSSTQKTIVGL